MAPTPAPPRFWHEPWLVAMAALVLPPLGLLLLASTPEVERGKKWALVALVGLFLLVFAAVESRTGEFQGMFREFRSRVLEKAARGLAREGRLGEARQMAVRANDLAPERKGTAWTASEVARKAGDVAGRRRWLEVACRGDDGALRDKAPARWLVELGRIYLRAGELERVDEVLGELEGARGKMAGAPALRAGRLLASQRPDEAEDQARRLVVDFVVDRFGEAYWEVARAAEARGDPLTAAYFYLEAYRHGCEAGYPEVAETLAARCKEAGVAPEPALAFLRALAIRGPFGGREVDPETAAEADRQAARVLEKAPGFWAGDLVLHTRASYRFYQLEDWEGALGLYQESLDRYPRGETRCRTLYQTVRALRKLERLDEAEIRAQETVRACPGEMATSARHELGRIRRQRLQETRDSR